MQNVPWRAFLGACLCSCASTAWAVDIQYAGALDAAVTEVRFFGGRRGIDGGPLGGNVPLVKGGSKDNFYFGRGEVTSDIPTATDSVTVAIPGIFGSGEAFSGGGYNSEAFAFTGQGQATSFTPGPVTLDVIPTDGVTPGTPIEITITAAIEGRVSVFDNGGNPNAANAWWRVASSAGEIISGSELLDTTGIVDINDSGTLTFIVEAGQSFDLTLDFHAQAVGESEGNSAASLRNGLVTIDAVVVPEPATLTLILSVFALIRRSRSE